MIHMRRKQFLPCPLYCLRIAGHLMEWVDELNFDSPNWWEVLHYWYSKHPSP
jgi:hypothetical protein